MSAKAKLKELKMKKQKWLMPGVLGLLGTLWLGVGSAQAATVTSISPDSSATLEISQWDSIKNIATPLNENQFPEPGQILQLVLKISGSPQTINSLLLQNTSYYKGICTNFGSPLDISLDFVVVSVSSGQIQSTDCGGNTQVIVNGYTFNLIKDSDGDGVPDWYEQQYCGSATCLDPSADTDTGPGSNTLTGDGISNFDEYRGFMVSGLHIRTDPRQKDLFVHLVNPQCQTDTPNDPLHSTQSLLGGGPTATTYVTGDPLITNLNSLISGTQIHLLGYTSGHTNYKTDEWVDQFYYYTLNDGMHWLPAGGVDTTLEPLSDRQINVNALYPITDRITGQPIQKGLRVIECVVNDTGNVLGLASYGSPNGGDNARIYSRRILNYIETLLNQTTKTPAYSTFLNGSWTIPTSQNMTPTPHDFLIAKAVEYYFAMELGHSVQLTPTVEGTSKTSYGYHHAPLTGSNLDQAITNAVTAKYGNTFYIPTLYNSNDQANAHIHN